MTINGILPILQTLPKVDKLRLAQFLVYEMAREEGVNLLEIVENYPI